MNPRSHAILVPLLAVLAVLLGLAETASAAFNPAAQNPHYGNFILQQSEASAGWPLDIADPTKGSGEWIYDSALGVPAYVRQNPWTYYDPLGLETKVSVTPSNGGRAVVSVNITQREYVIAGKKVHSSYGKVIIPGVTKQSDVNKFVLKYSAYDLETVTLATAAVFILVDGIYQSQNDRQPELEKTQRDIQEESEERVKYHYTDDETAEKIEKDGLWSESHVTDEGDLTSDEAVDRTGTTKPPTRVVPIKDKGQFKPASPPIVREHKNGDGGATDYYNPEKIPAEDILPSRPLPESRNDENE